MDVVVQPRDMPSQRIVENGRNNLKITRQDPFGFWYISYEKGPVPKVLEGAYTSAELAEAAIEVYLRDKK